MKKLLLLSLLIILAAFTKCNSQSIEFKKNKEYDKEYKTIHVFVALCDNKYQGIVPVPAKIGNGQDPANNLYWGCAYGIRTYFNKSKEWKLVKTYKNKGIVLERVVFKHTSQKYYLVADAYDGKHIKQCTREFLYSCSGQTSDTLQIGSNTIGIEGNSPILAYIGHDGLMDFSLNDTFKNDDKKSRDAIILACVSKKYFAPYIKQTNANPLVWTTGLIAPEAYTLHDAITGYIKKEEAPNIRKRAYQAYNQYQKCGEKAAARLLVTGW